MRNLTNKEIKELDSLDFGRKYETAVKSNYVIGVNCHFNVTVTKIANAVGMQLLNWQCNTCILKNIKKLGELYIKSKQELGAGLSEDSAETETENNKVKSTKRGRKPKQKK